MSRWRAGAIVAMLVVEACGGSAASSTGGTGSSGASGSGGSGVPPSLDGGVSGVVACGTGADAGDSVCRMEMPLQGGISETLTVPGSLGGGCGDVAASQGTFGLMWNDHSANGEISVLAQGAESLPPDTLGTFSLETLEITQNLPSSGGTSQFRKWKTPAGACTITITGSECSPTTIMPNRRVLYGNGSCSQPAAPELGNNGAPIDVAAFAFVGFIDPK